MAVSRDQMQGFSGVNVSRVEGNRDQSVSPREDAFEQCLGRIKDLLDRQTITPPKVFISYALEPIVDEGNQLHKLLKRLKDDLSRLGLSVFLDWEKTRGDMRSRIRDAIAESDYFFVIGTPLYKQKATDTTLEARGCLKDDVAFEYDLIQEKITQSPSPQKELMLVRLWYSGGFIDAFPLGISGSLRELSTQAYYHTLMGSNPLGLIPHLYPIFASEGSLQAEYEALVGCFHARLNFLTQCEQNPIVQAQPFPQANNVSLSPTMLIAIATRKQMLLEDPDEFEKEEGARLGFRGAFS